MSETSVLPLFLLPLVACPGEPVALHIFEPRYKEMIARCREREEAGAERSFAIFCSDGEELAPVGCTVRIARVLKEYEDGRSDILTMGLQRCRLVERLSEASYDTGRVQYLHDTTTDWDADLATRAFSLHKALIEAVTGAAPDDDTYSGHTSLSFFLAPSCGLTARAKNALLELRTEDERLEALTQQMELLLPQIDTVLTTMRSIAGSWEVRKLRDV